MCCLTFESHISNLIGWFPSCCMLGNQVTCGVSHADSPRDTMQFYKTWDRSHFGVAFQQFTSLGEQDKTFELTLDAAGTLTCFWQVLRMKQLQENYWGNTSTFIFNFKAFLYVRFYCSLSPPGTVSTSSKITLRTSLYYTKNSSTVSLGDRD